MHAGQRGEKCCSRKRGLGKAPAMERIRISLAILLLVLPTLVISANGTETCAASGEDFQLTYFNDCAEVCTQGCSDPVTNANDCTSLTKGCPLGTCTAGVCVCSPSDQLNGDPYSAVNISDNIVEKLTCSSNRILILVHKCALNSAGFTLPELYIDGLNRTFLPAANTSLASDLNNTCTGTFKVTTRGLFYQFVILGDLTACNGDVRLSRDGQNLTYTNAVKGIGGITGSVVSRQAELFVLFSCSFPTNINVTSDSGLTPQPNVIEASGGEMLGQFAMDIQLWTDSTYSNAYQSNSTINVNEYLYVSVTSSSPTSLAVQVLTVWATPSSSSGDPLSYNLIENGCQNLNDAIADGVVIDSNGQSSVATFRFRVFQFVSLGGSSQEIYIHATVHLCDELLEGSCAISCPTKRRRRELQDGVPVKTTSSIPFTVVQRNNQDPTQEVPTTNINLLLEEEKYEDREPNKAVRVFSHITDSWLLTLLAVCFMILFLILLIALCIVTFRAMRASADETDQIALVKKVKEKA